MKKILLTLGSIATVAAPIVAVVSCGDDNKTTTNPNAVPAAQQTTLKTAANVALGLNTSDIDNVTKAVSYDFTANGNKKTIKNAVVYKIKSDVTSFTVSNGAGATTTVATTGGGKVIVGSSDTALRTGKKFYIVTEVPTTTGTPTTTMAEVTDVAIKHVVEREIINPIFAPTTAVATQTSTISADAAKKIAEGLLADNRILKGIFQSNDMDAFVNRLIKLSITAQKALNETPMFEDAFAFSHTNKASVKEAATVIHSVVSGLIGKIPTVGPILKEKVTIKAIEAMLSEKHVTTGIMKLVHEIDILSVLSLTSGMQAPTLANLLAGFMPIGDHTAANPVTMVVPNLDTTSSLKEPKFKQGEKVSLSSMVDIDAASSSLTTAASAPAPAASAPASTGSTTGTTNAQQPLVKFDLMKDLMPAITPNLAVDSRQIYGQDVSQSVLMTFLGTFLAELGSHAEIVQPWTVDANGNAVKGKTGIVDKLVAALEMMVVTDANGKPVSSGFSIGKDTRLVNGKVNPVFTLITNGVLDVDIVNTNNGATYMASTFEMRSKDATHEVLATKAAGEKDFVFKTNTLPVKAGTKLGGKDITTITVPQLVHSIDLHGFKPLLDIILQMVIGQNPLILNDKLLAGNMVSGATQAAGGTEFLGMSQDPNTNSLSLNGLADNASAADKEAYDTALTEFLFQVAGEPEVFAEIKKQGAYAGAASKLAPIEVAEQHKRDWFVSFMEQMRAAGTKVTVDGAQVNVADAMQDVLDALKTVDYTAMVTAMVTASPGRPNPYVTHDARIKDQAVLDKVEKAVKAIIETRNIGMRVSLRIGSGNV